MIRFKTVRWKNFLSTGNAFTEVQLDKVADTLIVGQNGGGKSTLLDAICYSLFGTPFRKVNIPSLVNSVNKSDMLVEIEFTMNSHSYMIRRGLKPVVFEIWRDGKMLDQTPAREYQAALETQILHLNKKTFKQVAILGKADYKPFMQLVAAERREVIEDILDIQIFSAMNKLLKARQKTLTDKLGTNKHNCDIAETEYKLKTAHIEQLKRNKEAEIAETDAKIAETNALIQSCQTRINENNTQVEALKILVGKKALLLEKFTTASANSARILEKQAASGQERDFWSSTTSCPTCSQTIGETLKEERLRDISAKQVQYEEALAALSGMIGKFQAGLAEIATHEKDIAARTNENAKKLAEIKVHMNIVFSYEKKKKELENANADLDAELVALDIIKKRLKDLADERVDLNQQIVYLELVEGLLKDTGIKTSIIKQYMPVINFTTNKLLGQLDLFLQFELDESFKETIKSRHRDEFTYENFSEGEKQRIDMAQMLTWREVAKMKNSVATNILILDETFDSSLDGLGTEYLMEILHKLDNCNLFVISHRGDILQDKFGQVLKFHKVGNYSRIA
jgi:DNA repair exonuclease SbcCD ATPase subunit